MKNRVVALERPWAPLATSVDTTRAAIADMPRVVLIGHSAGAEIAMHVAIAEPARVIALVLIAPVAGTAPLVPARLIARPPGTSRLGGPMLRAGTPLFGRVFAQAWSDCTNLTLEVTDGCLRPLLAPGVAEALWAMTAHPATRRPRLPSHLPTLVLVGDDDRWTTPVEGGCQTVVRYTGCGHLPHEERPEEVLEAIRAFLSLGLRASGR